MTFNGDRLPDVRELSKAGEAGYTHFPVSVEIFGDIYTPVGLYLKLRQLGKNSFLLESAEGGENIGRYSFLGVNPFATFSVDNAGTNIEINGRRERQAQQPIAALRNFLSGFRIFPSPNLPRFSAGGVGYFGYDFVKYLEAIQIPDEKHPLPQALLNFFDTTLAVDNLKRKVELVTLIPLAGGRADLERAARERMEHLQALAKAIEMNEIVGNPGPGNSPQPKFNMTRDTFKKNVDRAKKYIVEGDIFQVVLSQRAEFDYDDDPFILYRGIRTQNPSPYMFYLESEVNGTRLAIIGSSPEMFVRKEGKRVEMRPIAGTRPRGGTPSEDEALTRELLSDEKEKAEHVMLVDLGRNDIGRVAEPGTVRVENFMHVERFSHVMHIVTDVVGTIREGKDAVETLAACFPAGTLSGAPKVRAMEIIAELEKSARQIYGGAVGYIDFNDNMDTCIAIRTFIIAGNKAYLQAGAGIVYDSDPEREYTETLNKMKANLEALKLTGMFR